ncbi:hypothetical protein R1sor_025262 [Riccia sorocarpa]|uniref:Fe2OG dioxygenase domain-containing protein n=1 Tax=Riccia sorocarpa TaxID=122646 RepID=A0ABD3GA49_9MARC
MAPRIPMSMGGESLAAEEPPVIDLSGITKPERRREIGRSISEALETWGFFQITNHGVEEALMKKTIEVFTEFFQSPDEEKLSIQRKISGASGITQGYSRPRTDGPALLNATEFLYNVYGPGTKEELGDNTDNRPSQPPSFRSTVEEYVESVDGLALAILGLISESLGLPQTTLPMYTSRAHGVRANYYQPTKDRVEKVFSVYPHTDPSVLTILHTNDLPATQVRKDDRWVQISPVPGAFLVNVGDLTEILSNGRYRSFEHRGLPHETQHRLTIATFIRPLPTTVVEPIPLLIDESHPPLYKSQLYRSYLQGFIRKGLDSRSLIEAAKISIV